MDSLPCKGCKGMCCGPVPVTLSEVKNLKKAIRRMPAKKLIELKSQHRFRGTCIFYDEKNDCCGVHSSRPSICRAFGHYQNLVCAWNPAAATKGIYRSGESAAGILSIDFTWDYFV